MAKIVLKEITHIYDHRVKAVDDLSIEFLDGKLNGLLGPSGCGKTTLLRIISGLIRPTSGRVYFGEKDVTELPPEERDIGMVFQFPFAYTTMTIYDNLAFPLKVRNFSRTEIKRGVEETAELLDLKPYLALKGKRLSPELKQKTSLGRAIIKKPSVLLLDEPLTYIEPKARVEMREKILELKMKWKQTIMYVTHDQAEVLTLSDNTGVMKDGKILQYDTPENLYMSPKNTFIAWFVGNPGMNLLDATYREADLKPSIDLGDFQVGVTKSTADLIEDKLPSNELIFGIRPEHVEVSDGRMRDGIEAQCALVEDVGNLRILLIKVGETEFRAKTEAEFREGEKVWARFPPGKIRIFDKTGNLVI